jgi:hypothetical protein
MAWRREIASLRSQRRADEKAVLYQAVLSLPALNI